jgi:hypothetical protein
MLLSPLCLVNHMDSLNYQWSRHTLESLYLWPWYFWIPYTVPVHICGLGIPRLPYIFSLGIPRIPYICGVDIPWIPSPLHPGYSMDF